MKITLIMAALIAVSTLGARPIPSAVVTATVSGSNTITGSIVRGTSIPKDSHIFNDKDEVLTAISTGNHQAALCELTMVGLSK
jgi:FlaG/FlaF family flagellin (archaellin)